MLTIEQLPDVILRSFECEFSSLTDHPRKWKGRAGILTTQWRLCMKSGLLDVSGRDVSHIDLSAHANWNPLEGSASPFPLITRDSSSLISTV